ncbi:hypothetical protein, partial [Nostoc sp.]|uniref:hypothetical protein n=1 Tax=Nostoc sp. TaxID=1180 RepID=UPI002FF54573
MNVGELRSAISALMKVCEGIYTISEKALRSKKSLSGRNFYAEKFHIEILEISRFESNILLVIESHQIHNLDLAVLRNYISVLKSESAKLPQRTEALRKLRLVCHSLILPYIDNLTANSIPATEQVLPLSTVQNTRGYIEKIILQANGCYEHQWYDACSVMIRRFIETLIIEVYEAHGKDFEIKDANGDFLMLRNLIDQILSRACHQLGKLKSELLKKSKKQENNDAPIRTT